MKNLHQTFNCYISARHSSQFVPPLEMQTPPGSQKLAALARQLRLHKPPPIPLDDIDEDGEMRNRQAVAQVDPVVPESRIPNELGEFIGKRAAVLVCIYESEDGDLRVILTKRSSRLSTHSGEVALPGGKAEEDDKDDGDTATREAFEEIGLDPSLVHTVTTLQPFISKHQLMVIPVIGILFDRDAFKPTLNPDEVEAIFEAPLEMFLKDENRRGEEASFMGSTFMLQFFEYETFVIWGLTAAILIQAASLVYQRSPAFAVQNPKVKFPRHFYRPKQLDSDHSTAI